jgi:ubiquinone biosynthesis protein COQ9
MQLGTETPKDRIIAAAIALAGEQPWRDVTLKEIAERAGMSLLELSSQFQTKTEILAAFMRKLDQAVLLTAPTPAPGQAKRDVLFEVIMARFDALGPHKAAMASIAAAGGDLALLRPFLTSQHWMLQAAGIATDGVFGATRVAGLGSLYGQVFQTWLADDDPGLARTMAALDRRLRRAESTINSVEGMADGVTRVARDLPGLVSQLFTRGAQRGDSGGDQRPN